MTDSETEISWQEKSVAMPDWTKPGKVHYWQNSDFDVKKPTILMIHGFRGDHHGLLYIANDLMELEQRKHNIVLIDMPAYGKTAEFLDAKNHRADHYADFLAAFLDEIKLKKPTLLAHSFGTTVTSRFLAKYANKVNQKVIWLSPIAKAPRLWFGLGVNNALVDFINFLPNRITHPIAGSKAFSDFISWSQATTKDQRVYENIVKKEHREYFGVFSSMDAMLANLKSSYKDSVSDAVAGLTKAKKDFLIIVGTRDKLVHIEDARWLKGQVEAQLVEISDLGHFIHYEAYDEIARQVKEFLV